MSLDEASGEGVAGLGGRGCNHLQRKDKFSSSCQTVNLIKNGSCEATYSVSSFT